MFWMFLVCATVGGTIMIVQFLLSLLGLGGDEFDGDGSADFDADAGHDHHLGDWLFSVLSFRTLVAALAFFGLAGLWARAQGQAPGTQVAIAALAGGAAMYGMYSLMRALDSLAHDPTFRIENSVGAVGAVYIPIPGQGAGAGKVQVEAQGRLMELKAITDEPERLSTGAKVMIVDVVSHDTVRVALTDKTADSGERKAETA